MFLKSLHLENIRCIEKLDLPLTTDEGKVRQWTILLGENGTGKSTILRSIALVLAGSEALASLVGDTDSWIRSGEKKAEIQAVLTTAKSEEREIALRFERGQNIRQMFDENRESLDALDRALAHSYRNYFTVGYGVSRRLAVKKSFQALSSEGIYDHPRANSVATLFAPEADLISFEAWAMDLDYRRSGEALDLIQTALGDFLPGVKFHGIDKEKRRLMFQTPDGLVPLALLSDGYQNAISWCGDLLFRLTETFEDFKNPLHARGLLLIDEVGLHLHLSWQRKLREYIINKFPHFQVIGTTHSPFTAHQAGEGELFSLVREDPADAEVELLHYAGAPNQLLLHQLIMTPFFGLNTMSSRKWEEIREEYRALEAKKKKTPSEKKRMKELEEQLEDQPDWSAGMSQYEEVKSLLQEIRAERKSK